RDFAPVNTEIGIAQVVGEDEQDVGARVSRGSCGSKVCLLHRRLRRGVAACAEQQQNRNSEHAFANAGRRGGRRVPVVHGFVSAFGWWNDWRRCRAQAFFCFDQVLPGTDTELMMLSKSEISRKARVSSWMNNFWPMKIG